MHALCLPGTSNYRLSGNMNRAGQKLILNDLPPTCFFEKALTIINYKSTLPGPSSITHQTTETLRNQSRQKMKNNQEAQITEKHK